MKTPGQVAFEGYAPWDAAWSSLSQNDRNKWENAAAAVLEEFSVRPLNASSNPEPPKTGCTVHLQGGQVLDYPDAVEWHFVGDDQWLTLVDAEEDNVLMVPAREVMRIEWHHQKYAHEAPADPQETLSETTTQTTDA